MDDTERLALALKNNLLMYELAVNCSESTRLSVIYRLLPYLIGEPHEYHRCLKLCFPLLLHDYNNLFDLIIKNLMISFSTLKDVYGEIVYTIHSFGKLEEFFYRISQKKDILPNAFHYILQNHKLNYAILFQLELRDYEKSFGNNNNIETFQNYLSNVFPMMGKYKPNFTADASSDIDSLIRELASTFNGFPVDAYSLKYLKELLEEKLRVFFSAHTKRS